MEYETIARLRDRHPSWRLLRAHNAPLALTFLGLWFVQENSGPTAAAPLEAALDEHLWTINSADPDTPRYPRQPHEYLEDWAGPESGWLRRFYPAGSDEVYYDATPAFERAYSWVGALQARAFVGTESRLHTVLELLRQIAHGTQTDPAIRVAELRRRRDEIDEQIAQVEAGTAPVLDAAAVRDRYQQLARTARDLLSDFREVEENFRALDRGARERIASWDGSKGELLQSLVDDRADISSSDQGRSFQAFHDFLLSESRLDELSRLLAHVSELELVDQDHRIASIHHDWSEAAERTQGTVRQLSEQLRRFLDERTWLENRRVLELIRSIEAFALETRGSPPDVGLTIEEPGLPISLPFERPLYDARPGAPVDSLLGPDGSEQVDVDALLDQTFIDQTRLAANVRSLVPPHGTALLQDILAVYPVEQGAAEIVGYLALEDEDLEVAMDEGEECLVDYASEHGARTVRLPKVSVTRR